MVYVHPTIPRWYIPGYTLLGTPPTYTVSGVLPGTLTPSSRCAGEEALGSNLGLIWEERLCAETHPLFLLRLVYLCADYPSGFLRITDERLDRRRVSSHIIPIGRDLCAEWLTLPAIRSLWVMRRVDARLSCRNHAECPRGVY